jgi:three-Cys-motif partner protein
MPVDDFHDKPFDEGTLTKLRIFELYAGEWLPVFLSQRHPIHPEIHLFDFFAGPGVDGRGEFGSPLRLLRQLRHYESMAGWPDVRITVHFFDSNSEKIDKLARNLDSHDLRLPGVTIDLRPLAFRRAFNESGEVLAAQYAAKLVFIDQFGVDNVTPDVFRLLVNAPRCDFLFFLSSSTLYRFRDHPAIKQKITRPNDYYHVHRAALEYYRGLLPDPNYYLAPFSIKKGSNIYGLIFGSGHPLGMDKFLQVAWRQDEISGEADFDIDRQDLHRGQLSLFEDNTPTKVSAFLADLEQRLKSGAVHDEADVIRVCFEHGVKRQHAESVLRRLKDEGVIALDFRVPDIRRVGSPRPITPVH